jgi:hypothetical protein
MLSTSRGVNDLLGVAVNTLPTDVGRVAAIEARLNALTPAPAGQRTFDAADVAYLLAELRKAHEKLAGPCGSCHPCTEWANQTWVNAGERLPHVYEWQEMKSKLAAYETGRGKVEAECDATDTETDEPLQADLVARIRAAITEAGA